MQNPIYFNKSFIFSVLCDLVNRREVYRILKAEGIQLPRYAVLNRYPARPEGLYNGLKAFCELNTAVFLCGDVLCLQMWHSRLMLLL